MGTKLTGASEMGVHRYINLKTLGGHVPVCPQHSYGPANTIQKCNYELDKKWDSHDLYSKTLVKTCHAQKFDQFVQSYLVKGPTVRRVFGHVTISFWYLENLMKSDTF